jgi:hypothetical protein
MRILTRTPEPAIVHSVGDILLRPHSKIALVSVFFFPNHSKYQKTKRTCGWRETHTATCTRRLLFTNGARPGDGSATTSHSTRRPHQNTEEHGEVGVGEGHKHQVATASGPCYTHARKNRPNSSAGSVWRQSSARASSPPSFIVASSSVWRDRTSPEGVPSLQSAAAADMALATDRSVELRMQEHQESNES